MLKKTKIVTFAGRRGKKTEVDDVNFITSGGGRQKKKKERHLLRKKSVKK